jgi:hypothetical protein
MSGTQLGFGYGREPATDAGRSSRRRSPSLSFTIVYPRLGPWTAMEKSVLTLFDFQVPTAADRLRCFRNSSRERSLIRFLAETFGAFMPERVFS